MYRRIPLGALAIWLLVGTVAALSCCLNFSAARLGTEYLPVGNDSFYHARRILDTVHDPASFYEFDTKIHAPQGSLLVWPWGYDYLMAKIVSVGMAVGASADPMAILVWIPVAAVFLSIGLLVVIARGLSLSYWATTLAALCMALAPTTQLLHGVGEIDHHYAEMIFLLASLAAGLSWMRNLADWRAAALVAATLGLAPAIHNALFILQIPLLVALAIRWLQDEPLPRKSAWSFGAVLLGTTLAILIPSLPFRLYRFEFYTLSWFHLYIALGSAAVVILLSVLRHSQRGLLILLAAGVALLLPILKQMVLAQSFLTGSVQWLEAIGEMTPPARLAMGPNGVARVTNFYSYLIWLAPLTWLLCAVQCWRERASQRLLFWMTSLAGLTLLFAQMRMHYFGDFALYLPWLILAQDWARQRPLLEKKVALIACLTLLLLYAPVLRHQLIAPMAHGDDETFDSLVESLTILRKACVEDPGVILADNNAGHYIRYYTDCMVIADNFLLTPQHFQKMDEVVHLFSLSSAQLVAAAPQIKYVLARPLAITRGNNGQFGYTFFYTPHGLANELLLGAQQAVSPRFELLHELNLPGNQRIPCVKLYRIRPASSNDVIK